LAPAEIVKAAVGIKVAVIGVELRLRRERLSGDPRVRPLLQEVVHHIDPELLDGLDANQEQATLALIRTSFHQAIDLMENPAHPPGWNCEDPIVLEFQGQVSRLICFRQLDRTMVTLTLCSRHSRLTLMISLIESHQLTSLFGWR